MWGNSEFFPMTTNAVEGFAQQSISGLMYTVYIRQCAMQTIKLQVHTSGMTNNGFGMVNKNEVWIVLVCLLGVAQASSNCEKALENKTNSHEGIVIFKFDFCHVAAPFVVCFWVLLASAAKVCFHHSVWLSTHIPESCLLILLGIPIGYTLKEVGGDDGTITLTSSLFFYFLLPPIILDAGYFMPSTVFYLNIGTILLYAILGTIFNAFATGLSLYGVAKICDMELSLLHGLLFGSLIAAVDPVAVLAVFEEVHVHELLYMLVFGESVLNDAASVVLYRTFVSLVEVEVNAEQIGLAIASFFVVSLGGTLIGVIFALITSFITKFTEHVRVIEPVFVFLMAYMAYLVAEIFHFSGIMSILFCGIIMKPYVESNVSRKSHTTIKYFLKLLSSSTESIIFMLLGVSLVQHSHILNMKFIAFTLLFISIYRVIGVTTLTAFANKCGRLTKVKAVEQFIMSYGGLRGAVAFCLAILLKETDEKLKRLKQTLVTTTMAVVLFTVFIQGTTIKPLVECLGVKRATKREKSMMETVNDRVMGYVVAGIEEVTGVHGHGYWRDLFEEFNRKYLRKWLERDPDAALDEQIFLTERRLAFKHALDLANNPSMLFDRENGIKYNEVKRNASYALELALKAQCDSSSKPSDTGILDINILGADRHFEPEFSEAFNPHIISGLIPKARRQKRKVYSERKYTLGSLGEDEFDYTDRYNKIKRNALAHMSSTQTRNRRHTSHHRKKKKRHHHSKGHSKKPEMETLPEATEEALLDKSKAVYLKTDNESSEEENGRLTFSATANRGYDSQSNTEDPGGLRLPAFGTSPGHVADGYSMRVPSAYDYSHDRNVKFTLGNDDSPAPSPVLSRNTLSSPDQVEGGFSPNISTDWKEPVQQVDSMQEFVRHEEVTVTINMPNSDQESIF